MNTGFFFLKLKTINKHNQIQVVKAAIGYFFFQKDKEQHARNSTTATKTHGAGQHKGQTVTSPKTFLLLRGSNAGSHKLGFASITPGSSPKPHGAESKEAAPLETRRQGKRFPCCTESEGRGSLQRVRWPLLQWLRLPRTGVSLPNISHISPFCKQNACWRAEAEKWVTNLFGNLWALQKWSGNASGVFAVLCFLNISSCMQHWNTPSQASDLPQAACSSRTLAGRTSVSGTHGEQSTQLTRGGAHLTSWTQLTLAHRGSMQLIPFASGCHPIASTEHQTQQTGRVLSHPQGKELSWCHWLQPGVLRGTWACQNGLLRGL